MPLYYRLFIWMLLLFLLLLAGIFYSQLTTTRSFLITQQTAEIDNAIHAVGLAVTPYLADNDRVGTESVINAIFDGSLYQKVSLEIFSDQQQITREYPIAPSNVPRWFQQAVPIPTTTRQNTLTSGWLQLGKITVTSHPTLAYSKLWQSSLELLTTFGICFVIGVMLLKLMLDRLVKRPLAILQQKTRAIADNHFGSPLPAPATSEFKALTDAFNQMSTKLQRQFHQQSQEADLLRKRAYQDPDSGLGNRRRLLLELAEWLDSETPGHILIFRVEAIRLLRHQHKYPTAQTLVKTIGDHLRASTSELFPHSEYHLGRLSHTEFMLINTGGTAAPPISQAIRCAQQISHAQQVCCPDSPDPIFTGVITKQASAPPIATSVPELLALCDNALSQAQQNSNFVAVISDTQGLVESGGISQNPDISNQDRLSPQQASELGYGWGKQKWLEICQMAIANDQFRFTYQNVDDQHGHNLHRELFANLTHHNHNYPARLFMPALAALERTSELDCYLLQKASRYLALPHEESRFVAVNLALPTITDTGFIQWLDNFLDNNPIFSQQLIIELPEQAFILETAQTKLLCDVLNKHHFTYGIDNYGRHFDSIGYLRHFQPRYVKIDFIYTRQLEDDIQQDALRALIQTAHHLDITTIATRVETKQQASTLAALGVSGFQGFAIHQQENTRGETDNA
ncbi:hypothetical protein ABT56_11215 [Photobacterium aquae]|uniref:Diguanylate phosphodiesterase n=1 Tax=Photobacterium aquae TaxID=1195763 RepID=A0A0J1H0Z9_9GAMM|nr:EAL domain-containing protein [Photobacterium aquae]KLV05530.1 hypothetical protein ABT56_11215 [Photobacterium aquae]